MTFERPELAAWLPVAVLLVAGAVLWQWRRAVRLRDAYGGAEAARRLTGRSLGTFPGLRLLSVILAVTALLLAAAGARRDAGPPPPPPTPLDVVIALDVSHSMTARDVEPSRMERAKAAATALVEARIADRVAVTTFAGWPYPLVPLTDDADVAEYFLPWVSPAMVDDRHQGTALASTLGHARRTWEARPRPDAVSVLVILSDGESHGAGEEIVDSVAALADAGVRVWVGGVGTEEGAPLFVPRSSQAPLLDGSGGQVVAGYDPELLREIARAGGGGFHAIEDDDGIRALAAELRALSGSLEGSDGAPFDPTALLVLLGLAFLVVDAVRDAGVLERRRKARTRGNEAGDRGAEGWDGVGRRETAVAKT